MIPSWKMCHSESCFRLALCELRHIESKQNGVFLTQWIWSNPTFITEKQIHKCSSLALFLTSLHKLLCFRIWHLTCGLNMTEFAQCQSGACFRMADFSERHTLLIWNMFQDGTCFKLFQNVTQHVSVKWQALFSFELCHVCSVYYVPVLFINKPCDSNFNSADVDKNIIFHEIASNLTYWQNS